MISALEALERLQEGNRRFIDEDCCNESITRQELRIELSGGQEPFAIILGCSDSRVPAEIVFDQGLGDLFVIRVAGNIVTPPQIGSIEYAAEGFGTRLVVILGHSGCGAVLATLEELQQNKKHNSCHICSIIDQIRPSIEHLLTTELVNDQEALMHHSVRANIRAAANRLRHESTVLQRLIQNNDLLIMGAEYSLETGLVDFFKGLPEND